MTSSSTSYMLSEANSLLSNISRSKEFERHKHRKYRQIPSPTQTQQSLFDTSVEEWDFDQALIRCVTTVANVAERHADTIKFSAERFRSLIPGQKVAPVQFEVLNDQIVISADTSNARKGSEDIAQIAREEILEQTDEIVSSLENSNCHPQIATVLKTLGEKVRLGSNAIRIGLQAIQCQNIINQFSDELPDAILGKIVGHLQSVQMFIGQFDEWQKFCENSRSADLDEQSKNVLEHATEELADILGKNPNLSDPEVPRTLLFIKDCLNNPKMTASRTAYAALATVENLVSAVFNYTKDFLDETFRKSLKIASVGIGGALGLAAVGLVGAELIAPVAGAAATGQWIIEVLKLLRAP